MTGAEVTEEYGLKLFELSELLERGLPAYEPETGNRYISPEGCKKIGEVFSEAELRERYEPAIRQIIEAACEGAGVSTQRFADLYHQELEKHLKKIAERPRPPEGHAILYYRVHPRDAEYDTWLGRVKSALFRVEDMASLLGSPAAPAAADVARLEDIPAHGPAGLEPPLPGKKKKPEELLELYNRGMSYTELAKFYVGDGDPSNKNTIRRWAQDQLKAGEKITGAKRLPREKRPKNH